MTQVWSDEYRKLPIEVNKYLLPQEIDQEPIWTRKHHAMLLVPLAYTTIGLVIALILSGTVLRGQSGLMAVVWVLWVLLALHLLWSAINWAVDYFIVTPNRMMQTSGLFTRRVDMMPLGKVTDMSFRRSLGGRIWGYGEFVVESAGQDQALQNVTYLPNPEKLYRDVCDFLWPKKPPPDCKMCNGSGHIVLAEERRLVTATCPNCNGTGKAPQPTVIEYPEAIIDDEYGPSSDPNHDPNED